MERGQILVVATVVAAVGLFGLRVWSNSSDVDPSLRAGEAGGLAGGSDGFGSEGDFASGRPRAVGGVHLKGQPGSAGERGVSGERGSFGLAGRGTARAIGGAGSQRGGYVGQSGSRLTGPGEASGAFGSDSGGSKVEPRAVARGSEKAQLLDFLGSQPPSGNEILNDAADVPKEEVALEVKSTEDTSLASKAEDIEAPDVGDEGIKFTEGSQMTFEQAGGASGEAGTISLQIEPDWEGGAQTDNSLVQIRDPNSFGNRLQLVKNGRFLRFIVADNLGQEADISVDIRDWQPGELRDITATWGDGRTSLYIDGRLAGQNTYQGAFEIAPTTPLHLGSDYRGSDYAGANGVIRDFKLLTTARNP